VLQCIRQFLAGGCRGYYWREPSQTRRKYITGVRQELVVCDIYQHLPLLSLCMQMILEYLGELREIRTEGIAKRFRSAGGLGIEMADAF